MSGKHVRSTGTHFLCYWLIYFQQFSVLNDKSGGLTVPSKMSHMTKRTHMRVFWSVKFMTKI